MAEGFVPLSKTIVFWPGFLGPIPDFLDKIGLRDYSTEINDRVITPVAGTAGDADVTLDFGVTLNTQIICTQFKETLYLERSS